MDRRDEKAINRFIQEVSQLRPGYELKPTEGFWDHYDVQVLTPDGKTVNVEIKGREGTKYGQYQSYVFNQNKMEYCMKEDPNGIIAIMLDDGYHMYHVSNTYNTSSWEVWEPQRKQKERQVNYMLPITEGTFMRYILNENPYDESYRF